MNSTRMMFEVHPLDYLRPVQVVVVGYDVQIFLITRIAGGTGGTA